MNQLKRLILGWAALLTCVTGWAQTRTVSGQVTNSDGEALGRATVLVKNTTTGVFTDESGNYSISVNGAEAILVFRYVGYQGQEVTVGTETRINVRLEPENSALDEVVVVGYSSQKRSQITGSVSVIQAKEIAETPVLRVEQALQGRAAGIQVTQNSGSPGSTLSVRIRGLGTINNSDPLYVVDGVIVDGLDFLNPNDIETINVLKDAASTAIYGTQGANGVVLITTKTGKRDQKAQISYDGYYGQQTPWKVLNLLDAREYAIMIQEARIAGGLPVIPDLTNPASLGTGTDWQDAIFTAAPISSHQLSVVGGNSGADYALSGNVFSQQGIIGGEKTQFDRVTLRVNANYDLSEKLKAGTQVNFIQIERDGLPENNEFNTPLLRALNLDPTSPIQDANGNYLPSRYLDTDIFNPVNQINNSYDTWRSDRIFGSMYAAYEVIPHLTLKSTLNLDLTNALQDIFFPKDSLSVNDQRPRSSVVKNAYRWFNWQWDNTLTYQNTFAEDHQVLFLLGTSAINRRFENVGGGRNNLLYNDIKYAYLDNGDTRIEEQFSYGGIGESSLLSFFTRADYSYQGKYLASAIFRIDGSSKFGPNNKFGYFPSLSLGWVISEESFFNESSPINFLKVRGSWGRNGNQNISDFQYLALISAVSQGNGTNGSYSYTFGPNETIVTGNAPSRRPNEDVRWESTEQYDLGVDVGLWNDRLYLTADAFVRFTTGMLVAPVEPGHVGALNSVVNAGNMRNQGLEFSANYRHDFGQKASMTLGGNVALIRNELTSLGVGGTPLSTGFLQQANSFISRTEVGFPVAYFYGFETEGIFQDAEEVNQHAYQADGTAPGDLKFKDQNADGVINELDKVQIGNPTPDMTYGLTASFKVSGLDFSVFLQGVYGNEIYRGFTRYDFDFANQLNTRLNRWTGPGTSDTEPRAVWGDPNQNARISDYFVEDGSFLRIKNVQAGYSLPNALLNTLHLRSCRVYVAAQHLFTFTRYTGLDPEIGNRGTLEIGIDRGFYPSPRTYLGGVQIGL
ncbi:MAG: TonB-dependent receptor [Bacteroidia bacterium]|nr:TonB-dependent receptor [Bacteroidia bacterium]